MQVAQGRFAERPRLVYAPGCAKNNVRRRELEALGLRVTSQAVRAFDPASASIFGKHAIRPGAVSARPVSPVERAGQLAYSVLHKIEHVFAKHTKRNR